jgi:muramidase (phage lysozyme)
MGQVQSWAAVAALAALFLWSTRARAGEPDSAPESDPWADFGPGEGDSSMTPENVEPGAGLGLSLRALLYAIRTAEHGAWVNDGLRYFRFYGGSGFAGVADHPAATGEKRGVPLPDRYCRGAGLSPGCVSTAAGAYQIILPTWRRVREAGRWGPRLEDFGTASQDEAARRILMESGALAQLDAGNVEGAILRAGKQWASLPGSTSGQPQKSMEWVMSHYENGLNLWG